MLHTSNGHIKATGIHGALEARTNNSSIDVTVEEATGDRPLVLESSNGSITLNLVSWKGNEIRATTSNASVNVNLPSHLDARLRASTSNGHVNTDFEVNATRTSKTSLEGQIGQGGALIDLHSSNGNIRIQKR